MNPAEHFPERKFLFQIHLGKIEWLRSCSVNLKFSFTEAHTIYVQYIQISAIFGNFRTEIFAKRENKSSLKCENENFRCNPSLQSPAASQVVRLSVFS
jgi:hypothetical protein